MSAESARTVWPTAAGQPIGYYVHHHGRGHVHRFRAITAATAAPISVISELPPSAVRPCLAASDSFRQLPSDVPADHGGLRIDEDVTAGETFHWAPLTRTATDRLLGFVSWLADKRPIGVVVDVSAEAAMTCRLAGIATVVVRQHGDRSDTAHVNAYRSARRLLAPFPQELEHRTTPAWVRDRTAYAGFITAPCTKPDAMPSDLPGADDVVVLWGAGGGELDARAVMALAPVVSPNIVHLVGRFDAGTGLDRLANVRNHGWVDDPVPLLSNAPTLVASAGNNTVSEAAAAGCALIVVPQIRPFREQEFHADVLDDQAVAAVIRSDPDSRDWSTAMVLANERRRALADLSTRHGARCAAQLIEATFW